MTESQERALKWFKEHGGDGVRQGHGRQQVLAGGEVGPFIWKTWKALIDAGFIEAYDKWRLRLTKATGPA